MAKKDEEAVFADDLVLMYALVLQLLERLLLYIKIKERSVSNTVTETQKKGVFLPIK